MKSAIVIMTILGCGHGENACEYIRTVDAAWTDRTVCQAQAEPHLKASANENYPTVIALCTDKSTPEIAEQQEESPITPDIVVRKADTLDLIYDALPDIDDARSALSTLGGLTVSGARSVSRWLW